jgi:hypothetical protein
MHILRNDWRRFGEHARLWIFRSLSFVIVADLLGCTALATRVERNPLEIRNFELHGFSDDARLFEHLEKLSALEAERSAYDRERWERLYADSVAGSTDSVILTASGIEEAIMISGVSDLANFTPNLEINSAFAASITNNQEIGVDEGDIVKRVGDYVLLLRRGRLFSFEIGKRVGFPLRLVDRIDLPAQLPEDAKEVDAWYDEILIAGSTVVVIGYNYGLDATEIALFELSAAGQFSRIETIFLTSFDYFSGSNYASRLVDGDLVLYAPIPVSNRILQAPENALLPKDSFVIWPMRLLFSPDGEIAGVAPVVVDSRVYAGVQSTDRWPVIHAMLRCSLGNFDLRCVATGILGPEEATHYISATAFYLWLESNSWALDVERIAPDEYRDALDRGDFAELRESDRSVIYRIPLGDKPEDHVVGAVEVRGYPYDQFAFRERAKALDIFAIEDLPDGSEGATLNAGGLGRLIEIPLDDFEPELLPWSDVAWQELPVGDRWCLLHRFVREYLVYTDCDLRQDEPTTPVWLRVKGIDPAAPLFEMELEYTPTRVESLGDVAVIAGSNESAGGGTNRSEFWLSVLELGSTPTIVDQITVSDRFSNPGRSHAFNFAPYGEGRIMALPLDLAEERWDYDEDRAQSPTEIQFFGLQPDLSIFSIGRVVQSVEALSLDDECRASCEDWYGSARPFFVGSRIFGLIDYELIEAEASGGEFVEIDRTSALLH